MNDSTATATADTATATASPETAATPSTGLRKVQPLWHAHKTEDGATLEVALPGVAKDALELSTGRGFLKLEAVRKPAQASAGRLLQGVAAPDAYQLELRLAPNLDGAQAKARFEDGVLEVTLPLAEAAKPRRIEVG